MSVQVRMTGVRLVLGVFLLTGTAGLYAQPPSEGGETPRQNPMEGFAGIGLLQSPRIQKELSITEEQKTQLQELSQRVRKQFRDRFNGLENLSKEERRKRLDDIQKTMPQDMKKRMDLMRKGIAEILTVEQQKRWRQIELQQEGPMALERPDVAEAVGLTPEQKSKIAQVNRETQDKTQALFQEIRNGDRQSRNERIAQLRGKSRQISDEGDKTAMAILQPEQKKKLAELLGEPFQMERVQFFSRSQGDWGPNSSRDRPQP